MKQPPSILLSTLLVALAGAAFTPAPAAAKPGPQTLSVIAIRASWAGLAIPSAADTLAALQQTGALLSLDTYGKITLGTITVTDAITIPTPAGSGCLVEAAVEAARALAPKPDSYDREIYIFPGEDNCGYGGKGDQPGRVVRMNGEITPDAIEHELGHTLGLGHPWLTTCFPLSTSSDCLEREYGDPYSVMGYGYTTGFSAPELAALGLLSPPPLRSGASYPLRPLSLAPDALAVPTAQGTFWFENRQPVGSDTTLSHPWQSIPFGIVVHLRDPDWRLWLLPAFGVDPPPSQEWGDPVPKPFPVGGVFTVPGVFTVSYTGGSDLTTLAFAWLDKTAPARPTAKTLPGGRMILFGGGADAASGLARIELRFAGRLRSFLPGYASFSFRPGLAGPATVTAIDNAGNRSAPLTLTFTRNGPVKVGR